MRKGFKDSRLKERVTKKMSIQFLASHYKLLKKAYEQDNSKTVGELMIEVEETIAKEGFDVHEVLNECRTN